MLRDCPSCSGQSSLWIEGMALRVFGIERKEVRSRSIEGLRDSAHRHKRGRTVVQTQREHQRLTNPSKRSPCVVQMNLCPGSLALDFMLYIMSSDKCSDRIEFGCPGFPGLSLACTTHAWYISRGPARCGTIHRSFGVVVLLDLENDLRNRTKPQVVSAMSNP